MEELLKEIIEKLDVLIRINVSSLLQDEKYDKDKIKVLSQVGLRPKDIADIIKKDMNNVTAVISQLRKAGEL